ERDRHHGASHQLLATRKAGDVHGSDSGLLSVRLTQSPDPNCRRHLALSDATRMRQRTVIGATENTLVPALRMSGAFLVAAKFSVTLNLGGCQYLHGEQVVLEMRLPERCMRGAYRVRGGGLSCRGDRLASKCFVRFRLLPNEPLAEWDRLRLHGCE